MMNMLAPLHGVRMEDILINVKLFFVLPLVAHIWIPPAYSFFLQEMFVYDSTCFSTVSIQRVLLLSMGQTCEFDAQYFYYKLFVLPFFLNLFSHS